MKLVKQLISNSLIVLTIITSNLPAFSQNMPLNQVTISSPTAAALGKYGDVPVNYHTGVPQISVPLYTIKEGPLSLPISLDYHAGGLKVLEQASWVGAGWSLNAGGVITRTVVGAPDETTSTGSVEINGHFSHYGYNSYLYNANGQDWQSFSNGYKDGEPDLFFFNFNGITGKFFFSDDRTPVLVPEQDLKIEYNYTTGVNKSIQGFIITAPNGTKYYFGVTASTTDIDPVEKTISYTYKNGATYGDVISSWYLNKIESADGQFSINLTYQAESYGYYTTSMFPIDGNAAGTTNTTGYDLVKNIVQGVRLNQITFSDGSLSFNPGSVRTDLTDAVQGINDVLNTSATTLGNIQINGTGDLCKKFLFSYDYFTDNSSLTGDYALMGYNFQSDRKLLKLLSVQEVSCAGETIDPYQFTYFEDISVPRRLSFGIDHWGFNNGASNTGLIPTYVKDNTTITGADRESAWPAMRAGTLQKIVYPTGGYTLLDFEANSVYKSTTSTSLMPLASLVAHEFGQSQLTQTAPFTITGSGDCVLTVNNNSTNWSPTFSIKNSSNVEQGGGPWLISVSQTFTKTLTLPPGNYQATLSFPSNSGSTLINGADANVKQWQTVANTSNVTIGGLRIKTITNNDGVTANDVITSYDYAGGGTASTGILYSRPTYIQMIRNDLIRDVGYWSTSGFTPYTAGLFGCPAGGGFFYKSPGSIRPMATTQGNHVGYNEVRVSQTGQGYSVYRYYGPDPSSLTSVDIADRSINTSYCDASTPNYPPAPVPYDFMRGELKYEGHFNQSGQILKEAYYTPSFQNSSITTPGFIVHTRNNGSGIQFLGTFYTLTSARKTQMETTETIYSPGVGNVTTTNTIYYESAFHHDATRKSSVNSKGETLETKTKYAFDYGISTCNGISNCLTELTTALNSCQSTYNSARLACNGSPSCLTTAYLNYLSCQNQARINYINCRKTNFTNTSNAYKTCHDNAKANADGELKPILQLQDDYVNAPVEVSTWRNNNLLSSNFTRFDYGLNPTTEVYPDKTQLIQLASPSATFTNSVVSSSGTSIVKDSRYLDEFGYKFNKGNVVEQSKTKDISVVYLWGYKNQHPVAKITGSTYTTAQALVTQSVLDNPASDQALRDELNKLRTGLPGALVTTYTYSPLKGITSETDSRGKTNYYEYDNMGRLKLIRNQDSKIVKQFEYQYQQ